MKKIFSLLLMLLSITAYSTYRVPQPFSNTDIHDYIGLLKESQKNNLNQVILKMRTNSVEMAIVVLPDFQGYEASTVSLEIGRAWGVGKKGMNNGIVYILAPSMKKARLEIGPGLQGDLPDVICNRIQENVKTYYKEGKYYEGLLFLVTDIDKRMSPAYKEQQRLYSIQKQKEAKESTEQLKDLFFWIFILVVIGAIIIVIWLHCLKILKRKIEEKEIEENKIKEITYIKSVVSNIKDIDNEFKLILSLNEQYKKRFNHSLYTTIEDQYLKTKQCINFLSSLDLQALSFTDITLHSKNLKNHLREYYNLSHLIRKYNTRYDSDIVECKKILSILPSLYEKAAEELKNTPYKDMKHVLYTKLIQVSEEDYYKKYTDILELKNYYDVIINYKHKAAKNKLADAKRQQITEKKKDKEENNSYFSYSESSNNSSSSSSSSSSSYSDSGSYGGGSFDGGGSDSSW